MELLLVFIFGICIGSFLNVVIERIPYGEEIISSRSRCNSCKHKLAWYDLFPLLSFIVLRGKCRYCKKNIGFSHFLLEALSGTLFVLTFQKLGHTGYDLLFMLNTFFYFFIISTLLIIFFIDFKHGIIPDAVVFPGIFACLIYFFVFHNFVFANHFFSACASFLFFFFLWVVTAGRGMGFGDVKFAFFVGMFLGWPHTLVALYSAFLTGAVVSIILIIWGKKKLRKDTVPFGPFIVIGILLAFFFTDVIISFLPFLKT